MIDAVAAQLEATQYVHGTMFTTEAVEGYAAEVAAVLPMDGPRLYPVSGGSEAVETALKLARAYHLANGEPSRFTINRPAELLSRQHDRRARCQRQGAAPQALHPLVGSLPARPRGLRISV